MRMVRALVELSLPVVTVVRCLAGTRWLLAACLLLAACGGRGRYEFHVEQEVGGWLYACDTQTGEVWCCSRRPGDKTWRHHVGAPSKK